MTAWYYTENSYWGERRYVSDMCNDLFGPEDNSSTYTTGRWAYGVGDGRIGFRSEEDLLWFMLHYIPTPPTDSYPIKRLYYTRSTGPK